LLGSVEENGKHSLIMEYVGGGSLRDLIDEQARLPIEAVLNIALIWLMRLPGPPAEHHPPRPSAGQRAAGR